MSTAPPDPDAILAALKATFPDWHIWQDHRNIWHALRKGGYVEHRGEHGATLPASLHNDNPEWFTRDLMWWEDTAERVRKRYAGE